MVTNTRPNQLSTTPNINPDLLRQVEKEDFLPPISPWISIGGLVIVATFGITVALAAVSQYNITIKTTGTVRPAGELKVVQASIEGIVKRIEVKENQLVKKGAPIVYLDDSQLQIQKAQLFVNIKLDKSQLTEINNQINSLNAQMVAEQNVTARTVATARAELSRNERDYQDWLVRTNSEIAEAQSAVKFAQTEMEAFTGLASYGAVSRLQAQQKNQIFIAAKQRLQRAQAVADPSAATIAIAKERIVQEQARGQVTIATLEKERSQLLQRRRRNEICSFTQIKTCDDDFGHDIETVADFRFEDLETVLQYEDWLERACLSDKDKIILNLLLHGSEAEEIAEIEVKSLDKSVAELYT